MKILHLIYDDIKNPWCGGGGAVRAYEVNRRLAKKHHHIVVLTGNYPNAQHGVIDGVRYYRVGSRKNYLLSRLTFSLQVPIISKTFKSDLLINDFSAFSPCFVNNEDGYMVLIVHHLLSYHAIRKYGPFGIFPFLSEKVMLRLNKNIITVNPAVKAEISRINNKANVTCILNGIDEDLFKVGSSEKDYILFLGRIDVYMKGLDILIGAFSKVIRLYPKVKLKVAGMGKLKDMAKLNKLIERLDIDDRVEVLGRVSQEEKVSLLANSMFICMPSRFEGWGIVAIEAAAVGKPVIGTNIPGLSEAVIDDHTGILVPPEDAEALSEAMMRLLEDGNERRRLGENARRWARNFSWDKVAEEQESFYYSIVGLRDD